EVLDPSGCVAAEPGLAAVRGKIVGGLRLPNDETGDCFKFTTELAKRAEALGVRFRLGVEITELASQGDRVTAVRTSQGDAEADLFIGSLGSYTPGLAAKLGLRIPVYPVKGYSITIP